MSVKKSTKANAAGDKKSMVAINSIYQMVLYQTEKTPTLVGIGVPFETNTALAHYTIHLRSANHPACLRNRTAVPRATLRYFRIICNPATAVQCFWVFLAFSWLIWVFMFLTPELRADAVLLFVMHPVYFELSTIPFGLHGFNKVASN